MYKSVIIFDSEADYRIEAKTMLNQRYILVVHRVTVHGINCLRIGQGGDTCMGLSL